MNGKQDDIKELFQKELGNYKAKVNPNIWKGIQSGIGTAGSTTGASSFIGLTGKIIIGAVAAISITVGTVLLVKNKDNSLKSNKKELVEKKNTFFKQKKDSFQVLKNKKEVSATGEELFVKENLKKINSTIEDKNKKNTRKETPFLKLEKEIGDKSNKTVLPKEKNTIVKENKELVTEEKRDIPTSIPSNLKENKKTNKTNLSIVPSFIKKENQIVQFSAEGIPKDAIVKWDFGDGKEQHQRQPVHFYEKSGTYKVSLLVKAKQEKVIKYLVVEVKVKGELGKLPNVFTPNGDGKNDIFYITTKNIETFHITIMNKQNKVVYSSNNPAFKWNGYYQGKPIENGVYIYIIVAKDIAGNTINKIKNIRVRR